ncbi:MAG: hypothetical protein ABJN69_01560 [Hellea sp.]
MTDMTPEQITKALEAGIITTSQAEAMRAKAGTPDNHQAQIGNEDEMRFLRSFSDVFIAIGVGLFALGLSVIAGIMGGGISFLLAAAAMWAMAEYFGRKKRAHLPTLITALAFLIFVQRGVGVVLNDLGFGADIVTALITLGAMGLFYLRIRLPFCIALIALAGLYLAGTIINRIAPEVLSNHFGIALFVSGAIIFAAALLYDMRDKHRTTRFADNAFWLHFLAAPLIIHGLALTFVDLQKETLFGFVPMVSLGRGDAALVILIVVVITFIGLAINRRALIVSSLGYAAFAMGYLFDGTGMGLGTVVAMTLLVLGGAIIFLGAGWHTARNAMLKILPKLPIFPPPFDPHYKP